MRRRRSTTTKSGWICTSASSSTGRSTDPSSGTQTSESDGRLGCDHSVDAEQLLGIGPDFFGSEAGPFAQFLEFGDRVLAGNFGMDGFADRKSTRLNSSHSQISYAVFCLKKKKSVDVLLGHTKTPNVRS